MSKAVGILINGEVEWHAPGHGATDYNSLCGLDADDPKIGHGGLVSANRGQKITCMTCKVIWESVLEMRLRKTDFDV